MEIIEIDGKRILKKCTEDDSHIVIPKGITDIGTMAFLDNKKMLSVEIPEGVKTIDGHAFEGCASLKSIKIPESVTYVGWGAFEKCNSLELVEMPQNLSVDLSTFKNTPFIRNLKGDPQIYCGNLLKYKGNAKKFDIPEGIHRICERAFYGRKNLRIVTIPESVKEIGASAFLGCTQLEKVVIPEGVKKISREAFSGCEQLAAVILPSTLVELEEHAFSHCTNLQSIIIPKNVNQIGKWAFTCCTNLKSVNIPKGVTSIKESTFSYCERLESINIPDSVTTLEMWAFYWCKSLTTVDLPDNLHELGYGVFEYCKNLTSLNLPKGLALEKSMFQETPVQDSLAGEFKILNGNLLEYIGDEADVIIPDNVHRISDYAFHGSPITSIKLPNSVVTIGGSAFNDCKSLEKVTLSGSVKRIEDNAFKWRSNLKTIELPDSLNEIGGGAFSYCKSLENVLIPESVTFIGYDAFENCIGLQSVQLPCSISTIERHTFTYCANLKSIAIPTSVLKIDSGAFERCRRLETIEILGGLEELSDSAFINCENLTEIIYTHHFQAKTRESHNLYLMKNVFIRLNDLKGAKIGRLFIPQDNTYSSWANRLLCGHVEQINEYDRLFTESSLPAVDKAMVAFHRLDDPFYLEDNIRKMYVDYLIKNSRFIIPKLIEVENIELITRLAGMNAINQKHVKGFIDKANKEQKVEILAFLMNFLNKKIEDSPTDDYQLTGIKPNKPVFPWTSKVNKDNTLTITTYKCKDLDITIPASIKGKRVTTVGYKNMRKSIFHEFPDITSVLISEGILRIENAVFYFCTKLKHITLPNSLNYIGDYAFASCVSLTSIIIPEGVETINDYTYKNCESLTSVNIPKTVGKIGHRAFDGCINLSSITFPEGVHTMEYGVFQDCHKLTDVFLPASLTTINPTNFTKLEKIMVHAPKASYAIEFAKRKGLKVVEV